MLANANPTREQGSSYFRHSLWINFGAKYIYQCLFYPGPDFYPGVHVRILFRIKIQVIWPQKLDNCGRLVPEIGMLHHPLETGIRLTGHRLAAFRQGILGPGALKVLVRQIESPLLVGNPLLILSDL